MSDQRQLLRVMSGQLYADIRFIAERNPTQVVDDEGAKTYNALLGRLRRAFPGLESLSDFGDWSPRTIKYKDALMVAGQIHALVAAALAADRRAHGTGDPGSGAESASGEDYEKELYGSGGVKRREDGTIPFSLDLD